MVPWNLCFPSEDLQTFRDVSITTVPKPYPVPRLYYSSVRWQKCGPDDVQLQYGRVVEHKERLQGWPTIQGQHCAYWLNSAVKYPPPWSVVHGQVFAGAEPRF
jgi:hypothetical protein